MSFGKDNSNLGQVASYGGSSRQKMANAGRTRKRGGSSGRLYWMDTFKPSLTTADMVRLVRGEYEVQLADDDSNLYTEVLPWFPFREHFHGTFRNSGICSGGALFFDKTKRESCHGCDIFWTEKDGKGKRVISMSDKFAFRVIDMGQFHKVPQTDKNGQYKINEKTGKPFMTWDKCSGMGCTGCQTAEESKMGHIQPWMMSKSHFNALDGYAENIENSCVTCKGRGTIAPVMWQCRNPACGELIFDIATTTATKEQLDAVVNAPFTCATCQTRAYPEEVIQCANCTPNGRDPVRASIFDIDMQVKAQKTGDNDATALLVLATSDPKDIDPQFQDLLQYAPNLKERCAPTSLDSQAQLWKISGGAAGASRDPGAYAGTYGQGQ